MKYQFVQKKNRGMPDFVSTPDIHSIFLTENRTVKNFYYHKEIYLSDPEKVASDKLKTVLQYQVG
jgi:hypothetical protein